MNGPVCFDVIVRGMGGSSGVLGEGGNEATEPTRGEPGWAPGAAPPVPRLAPGCSPALVQRAGPLTSPAWPYSQPGPLPRPQAAGNKGGPE